MIKSIESLEKRTEEVLKNRHNEITEAEKKLAEAKQAALDADSLMESAIESDNSQDYSKAKADKASALDAIELAEKRLSRLKAAPLITETEYKKYVSAVMDEMGEVTAGHRKKVVKIIGQLETILKEENELFDRCQPALERWQHEIYRDQDRTKMATGKIIFIDAETKRFNDFRVMDFIRSVTSDGMYESFLQEVNADAE